MLWERARAFMWKGKILKFNFALIPVSDVLILSIYFKSFHFNFSLVINKQPSRRIELVECN